MTEKTAEQEMESKPVDNKTPATEATVEETITEQNAEVMQDSTTIASDKVTKAETAPEPEPLLTDDEFDNDAIVPGSLSRALKQCRNQADLTLEQAAQEIRLPVNIVKALEDENFTALPEAPYVRGYLRSYARLSDSDPNLLIQRFEILRGANPNEITSFNSPVTRNPKPAKKEVSPTTIKLAGFSIIVLLLVVLSMIPTVSQKASNTWKTFSEPQQPVTAGSDTEADKSAGNSTDADDMNTAATENNTQTPNNGATQNTASATETTRPATPTVPMASSRNDTATTPDKSSEQLALNQQDELSTVDGNGKNGADTTSDTDTPTNDGGDTATSSQAQDGTENTQNDSASATGQAAENPAAVQQTGTANSDAATTESADGTEKHVGTTDTNLTSSEENTTGQAAQDTQGASAVADEGDGNTADADGKTTDTDATQLKQAEQMGQSGQTQDADAEEEKKKAEQAAARQAAEDKRKTEQARQQNDRFRQPFDGNVLIRLVFSQPVWMSIKDGKGKTIFGSLNAAGTVKELKARTPLQFHVGNAPGVKIYLNGQLVDQRPHTRGSVARFRAN